MSDDVHIPPPAPLVGELELELDNLVDQVLDLLERSARVGVELDPLTSIMRRLQARGDEINLDDMPPMMKMLIGGMLG